MKGNELLLIGVLAVLVALAVPGLTYGYVEIEQLAPDGTQEVETVAAEAPWMPLERAAFSHDTARIELLFPADAVEVETGAGEIPVAVAEPAEFSHDTARIELLLPAN